jgi:small-conductance mechanosensitive channel
MIFKMSRIKFKITKYTKNEKNINSRQREVDQKMPKDFKTNKIKMFHQRIVNIYETNEETEITTRNRR